MEAIHISDKIGGYRPITEQCQYNMLERQKLEADYVALFDDYNYGASTWSPLSRGILTGRFNNGIPKGSEPDTSHHRNMVLDKLFAEDVKEKNIKRLNDLAAIATELGCTFAQLAIAWTLKNKNVSTCILGASSEEQLRNNIASIDFVASITPEVEKRIGEILDNAPEQQTNFITWKPLPGRR